MKNTIIIFTFLLSGFIYSQDNKPKLEVFGQTVKATYYHANGKVQQEGNFLKGKLEGTWTSFDENGNKIAVGNYENGTKTGKWFFWNGANLNEVDYSKNQIANVKTWTETAIAKN